jgi:hypothetical protein
MFDSKEQNSKNQKALDAPRPGDYWQEMFCPYFVVVDVKDDQYTVLSCMGGPNSYTRKDEPNARIEIDKGHWGFDYSKSMIVDRAWIERAVKYGSIDGFVADVINSDKTQRIVTEWRHHKQQMIKDEIRRLQSEWEEFTGWKYLKEEVSQ